MTVSVEPDASSTAVRARTGARADTRESEQPAARERSYSYFPPTRELRPLAAQEGPPRVKVVDRERDAAWVLGEVELKISRLFDGRRTLEDVQRALREEHGMRASMEKLQSFEERLLKVGVLQRPGAEPAVPVDPFTGTNFGPLHKLVVLRLVSLDPDRFLDRVVALWRPKLRRPTLVALAIMAATASLVLALDWNAFVRSVGASLNGWGWPAFFAVLCFSGVFHEGGHALACKAYGVRVRETGLALLFLIPTGWLRPDQEQWSALPRARRVATIWAGPFGSVVFGALGVFLWRVSPDGSMLASLGVFVALSTLFGTLVTLCPTLSGDGYLLVTEYLNVPGLRTKSFRYVRSLAKGDRPREDLSRRRKALYLLVSSATAVTWLVAWPLIVWLIVTLVAREAGSAA